MQGGTTPLLEHDIVKTNWRGQIKELICPLQLEEIFPTLNMLPSFQALGRDGLPLEFFLKLWNCIGNDFFEVFKEALDLGMLSRDLNIGSCV